MYSRSNNFYPTIILRHGKENLKKCSLRGLETSEVAFANLLQTPPIQELPFEPILFYRYQQGKPFLDNRFISPELKPLLIHYLETQGITHSSFGLGKNILNLETLSSYVTLSLEGPPLSEEDQSKGLFLIDSTWKYEKSMEKLVAHLPKRSLPSIWKTAYPREQNDCSDPSRGLATIEALFAAFSILEKKRKHLLSQYHWREKFLKLNNLIDQVS